MDIEDFILGFFIFIVCPVAIGLVIYFNIISRHDIIIDYKKEKAQNICQTHYEGKSINQKNDKIWYCVRENGSFVEFILP